MSLAGEMGFSTLTAREPMPIARISDGLLLAALCFARDAHAERFVSDCAGKVEIAHAHVARVERDGALVLADGRLLRLEGIRLALEGPDTLTSQVLRSLSEMAQSGTVSFTAAAPSRDRYGRLRVQGFGQQWLQVALLEQGLARVAMAPDRSECAPDPYEDEARGRAKGAGLWALKMFGIRTPEQLKGAAGGFQIVEGIVSHIGRADGRSFLDFGDQKGWGFSAVIAAGDRRAFRDFDIDELSGHRVRVRGIVQNYRGRPEIGMASPAQMEVLD